MPYSDLSAALGDLPSVGAPPQEARRLPDGRANIGGLSGPEHPVTGVLVRSMRNIMRPQLTSWL